MTTRSGTRTLIDLGERAIVEQLIAPRFPKMASQIVGIGDDAAVLPQPAAGHHLVVTIDPCPTPVACLVAPPDFYHYGFLTAVINLSDLAAMGAEPLGLTVSTVMPEAMEVSRYERFLDGLADACTEWACPVVGGNIKDGPEFTATGSALGAVRTGSALLRSGARVGDKVCVVGPMGLFWAAVLARLRGGPVLDARQRTALDEALFRPVPRLREGSALAASGHVTACMDSSDGVIGCLWGLALSSGIDIVVDDDRLAPPEVVAKVAGFAEIDPRKLMLSWGDWQLVCTVRSDGLREVFGRLQQLGAQCHEIGETRAGPGVVWLREGDHCRRLNNFASERFCKTSFFSHGLEAYLEHLQSQALTRDDD